jgi:hypothetical protein
MISGISRGGMFDAGISGPEQDIRSLPLELLVRLTLQRPRESWKH